MLKLSGIFTSHMVLQRRKPVPVWGTAAPGAQVTVALAGQSARAEADGAGQWRAVLPAMEAGGPYVLTASCGAEQVTCADVMLGEVWLAGGQSNMEMPLREARGGRLAAARSGGETVRFYQVPRRAVPDGEPLFPAADGWQVCAPETSGEMSAVAYFFARQIARTQQVAVGIVLCCWGGTSVSCWMSRARLEESRAGQRYLDGYAALVGDKTEEDYRREMTAYDAEYQAWCARVDAERAKHPRATWEVLNLLCGPCPWPQPAGPSSPFRPAGLYESMLRPVCPYGLRGFLYYQGEEDCEAHFDTYAQMMTSLIDLWRSDWGEDTLPFLFVQLPMYVSRECYQAHQDDKHWPYLRDEQKKVSRTVANTAMAVLTDCGEFDNVHPLDKETVGNRLALLARQKVYGEPVLGEAPQMERVQAAPGGRMEVRFSHTGGSLTVRGDALEGFELAGADGVYHPARGTVQLDTVTLWSDAVPRPETVRYAWFNYGPANLYSAAGLAAAPFRTDHQPVR